MTITANKPEHKEAALENWHRRERVQGKIRRSYRLPIDVDKQKTDAKFENGVLTITFKKKVDWTEKRKLMIS